MDRNDRRLSGRAGTRIPTRSVSLFFKVDAGLVRLCQIHRVLNSRGNDQVGLAVVLVDLIEKFGQHRVCAIRCAILSQVSWLESRGNDFQRTTTGSLTSHGWDNVPPRF